MAKKEIEFRGPLTKIEFNTLRSVLKNNAEFLSKNNRLSLIYFRDIIPEHSDDLKDEKVDLRLRITNGKSELVMKYGFWSGNDKRKEYSFDIENFFDCAELLKHLGWSVCVSYATKSEKYIYKDIEFKVEKIVGFGYVYEAEIVIEMDEEEDRVENKIKTVCNELGLREYAPGEFEKQCDEINNTDELQHDFNKEDVMLIKEQFSDFF